MQETTLVPYDVFCRGRYCDLDGAVLSGLAGSGLLAADHEALSYTLLSSHRSEDIGTVIRFAVASAEGDLCTLHLPRNSSPATAPLAELIQADVERMLVQEERARSCLDAPAPPHRPAYQLGWGSTAPLALDDPSSDVRLEQVELPEGFYERLLSAMQADPGPEELLQLWQVLPVADARRDPFTDAALRFTGANPRVPNCETLKLMGNRRMLLARLAEVALRHHPALRALGISDPLVTVDCGIVWSRHPRASLRWTTGPTRGVVKARLRGERTWPRCFTLQRDDTVADLRRARARFVEVLGITMPLDLEGDENGMNVRLSPAWACLPVRGKRTLGQLVQRVVEHAGAKLSGTQFEPAAVAEWLTSGDPEIRAAGFALVAVGTSSIPTASSPSPLAATAGPKSRGGRRISTK